MVMLLQENELKEEATKTNASYNNTVAPAKDLFFAHDDVEKA